MSAGFEDEETDIHSALWRRLARLRIRLGPAVKVTPDRLRIVAHPEVCVHIATLCGPPRSPNAFTWTFGNGVAMQWLGFPICADPSMPKGGVGMYFDGMAVF